MFKLFKLFYIVVFRYEAMRITPRIHQFIHQVYVMTASFPRGEQFGLTSQIRRASVSVLLNIAEGSSRKSRIEFARFTKISIGSIVEVDAGLKVAVTLGYINEDTRKNIDGILQELYFSCVALRDSMSQPKCTS